MGEKFHLDTGVAQLDNAVGMYATHLILNTNIAEETGDKVIEIYNKIISDINKEVVIMETQD